MTTTIILGDSPPTDDELLFDEANKYYSQYAEHNALFLTSVQDHLNRMLLVRGHVFLNEAYDHLGFPRTRAGALTGWIFEGGRQRIDFYMTPQDAAISISFRTDGFIIDLI